MRVRRGAVLLLLGLVLGLAVGVRVSHLDGVLPYVQRSRIFRRRSRGPITTRRPGC